MGGGHAILRLVVGSGLSLLAASAAATTMTYDDRGLFEAGLGRSITDDYSNPGYVSVQDDARMSFVLGETSYQSTGFRNSNVVTTSLDGTEKAYCAGCNGSFRLTFAFTSVGDATGVFGVGLDIELNDSSLPYSAFVTFGDFSTRNYVLPAGPSFFGITDGLASIRSIHFALNNTATRDGFFKIDNLTIGDAAAVPAPGALAILGLGLAGLGLAHRRRRNGPSDQGSG